MARKTKKDVASWFQNYIHTYVMAMLMVILTVSLEGNDRHSFTKRLELFELRFSSLTIDWQGSKCSISYRAGKLCFVSQFSPCLRTERKSVVCAKNEKKKKISRDDLFRYLPSKVMGIDSRTDAGATDCCETGLFLNPGRVCTRSGSAH